jgi:hypothetical protein
VIKSGARSCCRQKSISLFRVRLRSAYPLSPRVRRLKELLAKIDPAPAPAVSPYPAPKPPRQPRRHFALGRQRLGRIELWPINDCTRFRSPARSPMGDMMVQHRRYRLQADVMGACAIRSVRICLISCARELKNYTCLRKAAETPARGDRGLRPNRQLHKTRSKFSEHFEMRFSIGLLR